MTAKEAVEFVKANPEASTEDVVKLIPEYKWILHRNAWISTFKNKIPEEMKGRFASLK